MEINFTPMDLCKNDPKTYFYPQIKQLLEIVSLEDVKINILGLSGPGTEIMADAISKGIRYFIEDLRTENSSLYKQVYLAAKKENEANGIEYEMLDFAFDIIETLCSYTDGEIYHVRLKSDKNKNFSFHLNYDMAKKIHGEEFCTIMSAPLSYQNLMDLDWKLLKRNFFKSYYVDYLGTWCTNPGNDEIRDLNNWIVYK